MKCGQKDCDKDATSFVVWVDGKQVYGCDQHSAALQALAAFLGSSVALYPIIESEAKE